MLNGSGTHSPHRAWTFADPEEPLPMTSSTRLLLFLVLAMPNVLWAQATVRGKVTDATNGESLIGAAVLVKGTTPPVGTTVDFDGNYSLPLKLTGQVVLEYSFFGYTSREVSVDLSGGGVIIQNLVLAEAKMELKEFEVTHKASKRSDGYLDRMKINSATSFDFISRDAMMRTGDGDASQAVRRVTGVSTVGSFVTVRGLADRYVATTINGGRVPTLDPFTNNLRLDLFPTGLMDNIMITKTATPDLPGDWSGAYISLNTSDYPEKFFVNVQTTLGYNPNSSFKEIVAAGTSSTDRWGWDDGMRGIPEGVPDAVEDFPEFVDPSLYQQLSLLGLEGYLNGLGITSGTPGFNSTSMGTTSTLQHLALTELGLLAPALLYDATAVGQAVNTYNATYDLAYFSPTVNAGLVRMNTLFDNSRWRVGTGTGDPNYNVGITLGDQIDVGRKRDRPGKLGYLVGLRYSAETQYDGSSTFLRTFERYEDPEPGDQFKRKAEQRISVVSNGWNALGNLSFSPNRNHSIALMAMANVLGQNNARYISFLDPTISGETFISEEQFWEQRRLFAFQLGGKHLIPALNLTVTPDVSYSSGRRDMLDFMTVQYVLPPPGQPITDVDGALTPPGRIYRFLNERLLDARLGLELPLGDDPALVRKLKVGGGYRWNERYNDQKYYVVLGAPGPTQWEEPGRFDMMEDGRFRSRYAAFGSFKDNDIGILSVASLYAMADHAVNRKLRLAGGVRLERSDLLTDVRRYWELGLAAEDPDRGTVGDLSINGAVNPEPKPAVPGRIEQWDVLPSINAIWRITGDEHAPMNLRAAYFRSIGRPSFRELSVVQYYDYLLQAPVYGNPDLEMTTVDNYDLRLERFFKNGANLSLSGFYKDFQKHIELLQTAAGGFTWRNAERSYVVGAELEGRVNLVRWLEWRGNLTWMSSQSRLKTVLDGREREYTTPMFGQAPYIVNSTLSYRADSLGLELSVSYNIQGPKLAVTNNELDPDAIRAFEMPRHMIDITLAKRLGRHWTVSLRARDLLNTAVRRSYLFAEGYGPDFDSYRWGTEYQLNLSYTIR